MTTDVRLVTLDAMPSTTDDCSNSNYTQGENEEGGGDNPSPLANQTLSHHPNKLHRRYSTQPQEMKSRYRSSSGDSNNSLFSARTSPLTNIVFLDEFVKEEVGSGFFATVYKLQHRDTGQVMAAKINTNENNWDNVQHEIQLISRLIHPNINRFMGLCIHEGTLHPLLEQLAVKVGFPFKYPKRYLSHYCPIPLKFSATQRMRYINGGTLTDLLCDNQVYLSWGVRIGLASDIAGAMAYLHKKAIMHRDLTSSNVLIKRTGLDIRAIICDLGLSCRFPRELSGLKTPVGTPFWMAPECLHYKPYDEKADVFSFGIVLCEIIARVTADPEELPRLKDFGLDEVAFQSISSGCPEPLLELAFLCCKMNKCSRPAFVDIEFQLQHIRIKLGRKDRTVTDKGDKKARSRRHTVYLNVPNTPNAPLVQPTRKHPLVRSNSDRGARDRRQSRQMNRTNPFDTPSLKGGRTKFVNSGRDQLKQLSPDMSIDIGQVLSTLFGRTDIMSMFEQPLKRRLSVSLPSSPELHRREISMEEDDFFDDVMSWPSSSDTFELSTSRTPPPPDDTSPPYGVGESVESASCSSAQNDTTLSSNCNGRDRHKSNRDGLNGNDDGR